MDAEELKIVGKALWGRGWQTRLAEALGIDGSTVRRWVGAAVPVPGWARAYLDMMCDRQATRGALVQQGQRMGSPLPTVSISADAVLPSITRLLQAPGVPDPKRMPAIVALDRHGAIGLALTGDKEDDVQVRGVSLAMTRHPDPWHLRGYVESARRRGHEPVTTRHVDHYYSLVAHSLEGDVEAFHQIATHKAVIRTVWSDPEDLRTALREDLHDLLPPFEVRIADLATAVR